MVNVLAMPVVVGLKTAGERFAGADNTFTCEAMMGDGKALQMGTSHDLGQNFARAFDIEYLADTGVQETAWTTSWGVSTRMVGGLIMAHGDDDGLRVPPRLAPIQVVVLAVRDEGDVVARCRALADELRAAGVRVQLDTKADVSMGRRATDWELKGVPVRLEVGPRDLAEGVATLVRRITGGEERKSPVALDGRRHRRRQGARPPTGPRCSTRPLALRTSRTVDVSPRSTKRVTRRPPGGRASRGPVIGDAGGGRARPGRRHRPLPAPRRRLAAGGRHR